MEVTKPKMCCSATYKQHIIHTSSLNFVFINIKPKTYKRSLLKPLIFANEKHPMKVTLHSLSLSLQTPFNPVYHMIHTTIINKTLQINRTHHTKVKLKPLGHIA